MTSTLQPAISTSNPTPAAQLSAILHGAAVAAITDRAFLRITGPDATRWLNGMVTNNVQTLQPGEGNYNFLLNAQGRILGDCTIYRDPGASEPAFILETDSSQIETIQQHLDRFIIMDDVELADISDQRRGLLIAGPKAPTHLKENRVELGALHTTRVRWRSAWVDAIHAYSPLIPLFELWSDLETTSALSGTLTAIGATPVSTEALEALRILSGTPRYGIDIRNTEKSHDLPQETAQTHALHFSKGCYLGQEIVERIHSRGSVHRTFSGFQLTGALPEPGAVLTAEGKPSGELTSVGAIPLATPIQLALGYVRREALERRLALEYPGGTAAPIALPYPIP